MRERPEVEARLLARQIPPEARVVALAFPPGEEDRAARAAEAVAAGLSRRREHTLLASCEAAPSALDGLLGGAEVPGLWQAIRGEVRLTDVAVRPHERLYVYLPAGFAPSAPDTMATDERFVAFVDRARRRGGTLLLFAPERLLARQDFVALLDGYIALGRLEAVPGAEAPPEVARLDFGAPREPRAEPLGPEAEPQEAEPEPEGAGTQGVSWGHTVAEAARTVEPDLHAGAGSLDDAQPTEPEVVGDAVEDAVRDSPPWKAGESAERPAPDEVGEIPHAGAAAAAELPPRGDDDAEAEAVPARASDGAESGSERPIGRAQPLPGEWPAGWRQHRGRRRVPVLRVLAGVLAIAILAAGWWALAREAGSPAPFGVEPLPADDGGPPVSAEALEAAAESAPEAPYSVLIASYAAADDAGARLARLRRSDGGLYFAAPTPVRGAIYHRVFAGARAEPESGRTLMEELVRAGRKDEASAWDVRPARLAFRIAVFASETEARAEAERLDAEGVPAYILAAGEPGRADGERGRVAGEQERAAGEQGGRRLRAWQVYAGAYETEAAAGPMAALLERAGVRAELVVRRGEAR